MFPSNTLLALALGASGLMAGVRGWTTDEMRSKSVYQVVTDRFATSDGSSPACDVWAKSYCGGTWKGIENKLDYIQGMGFDAIWISPVVSNIGGNTTLGESYHGYWPLALNSLNSNFGSEQDLKDLVTAAGGRGMGIMVDVIVNHIAATASTTFEPNDAYAPFTDAADYHPFCWVDDYNNQTNVEQCSLGDTTVTLHDINTESDSVVSAYNEYIKNLTETFGFEAIRIDTVKHVRHDFWPAFVSASGVFAVGEVLDGDASYVASYQAQSMPSVFNYPIFYPLTRAFNSTSGSISALTDMISTVSSTFNDSTLLGSFLDNHDNPRFESTVTDAALIKNAQTYPFVTDGIPYAYYGSEQGFTGGAEDYLNREPMWPSGYKTDTDIYKLFTSLNLARSAAGNASSNFFATKASVVASSNNDLAIKKGPMLAVLSNRGSSGSGSLTVNNAGYSANEELFDVISCTSTKADGSGNVAATITNGAPQVFLPLSARSGNLCSQLNSSGGKGAAGRSSSAPAMTLPLFGLAVLASVW